MTYQTPKLSTVKVVCPKCKKVVERQINRTISTSIICDCGSSVKIV
jgi:phage FluMu protein Com